MTDLNNYNNTFQSSNDQFKTLAPNTGLKFRTTSWTTTWFTDSIVVQSSKAKTTRWQVSWSEWKINRRPRRPCWTLSWPEKRTLCWPLMSTKSWPLILGIFIHRRLLISGLQRMWVILLYSWKKDSKNFLEQFEFSKSCSDKLSVFQ